MNWTAVLVAAGVTFAYSPQSTQQSAPSRDAALAPTKGTASVSGIVVNDETPAQPVRRAVVVLAGNGLRPSRGAITDDAGRFFFSELPSGQFTITVSRASFITSMFGAKRGGRPGTPLNVTEGAPIRDLVVKLWRGAAVAGMLRDDTGAPVAGIEVTAIPARSPGSLPTLTNNGATTNELGEFRIFGLEPGAYIVAARPAAGGSAQYSALTDAQTDAALDALRRRTASAGVSAPAAPVAASLPEQRSFDYAPVYFPGTPVIGQATPLTLTAGQSHTGLDFSLQRVPTAMITGVVTRPDGSPAGGASLQLTAAVPTGSFRANTRAEFNATAAPDGSFRIAQVTPGDYQLVARAPVDPKAPGVRPGYVEPPSTPQLYAVTELSVTGTDLLGLGLSVNPGVNVAGRFAFESDSQKPPASLAGMRVTLVPDSLLPIAPGRGFSASALRFPVPAVAKADGTFELSGVAPGRYQLMAGASGVDLTRWQLKSATAGGTDVLDGLIEIFPGSSSSLVVTYDDRPTSLSGRLETASGTPASDVVVIAFAATRELWGPYTRRIKAVRPGVDGSFSIQGLPAGDYVLAAVMDADPDDWQNPAFLEQLIPAGVPITLVGGQPLVQALRIGR